MSKGLWVGSSYGLHPKKDYYFLWEMPLILVQLVTTQTVYCFVLFFHNLQNYFEDTLGFVFLPCPLPGAGDSVRCQAGEQYVMGSAKPLLATKGWGRPGGRGGDSEVKSANLRSSPASELSSGITLGTRLTSQCLGNLLGRRS